MKKTVTAPPRPPMPAAAGASKGAGAGGNGAAAAAVVVMAAPGETGVLNSYEMSDRDGSDSGSESEDEQPHRKKKVCVGGVFRVCVWGEGLACGALALLVIHLSVVPSYPPTPNFVWSLMYIFFPCLVCAFGCEYAVNIDSPPTPPRQEK